eukprot:3626299-Prymnesium_polylepis.1
MEQLERRAAAEGARAADALARAEEAHRRNLGEYEQRVGEAQEARLKLAAESASRRAAAEALGERVALLQAQVEKMSVEKVRRPRHHALPTRPARARHNRPAARHNRPSQPPELRSPSYSPAATLPTPR